MSAPGGLAVPALRAARWCGVVLCAVAAVMAVRLLRAQQVGESVWWLVSVAIGAIMASLPAPRRDGDTSVPSVPWWGELAGVAVIFAVACWARLYALTRLPPYIFVDEAHMALDGALTYETNLTSPFGVGWWSVPSLYFYYSGLAIAWLGHSELAMRLPGAISGIVACLGVYALCRLVFGVPLALALGLLFAGLRWHVGMSRWGHVQVSSTTLLALTLLALTASFGVAYAARNEPVGMRAKIKATALALLAGLFLGLGLYTYAASQLVPFIVGPVMVWWAVLSWRAWRTALFRLALALIVAATAAAVFAPLAKTYRDNPHLLQRRANEVNVFKEMEDGRNWGPLYHNLRAHAGMFHVLGDQNGRHNYDRAPMLNAVAGALFLMGLGFALARCWQPIPALVITGLVVTMAGGVFSNSSEAPQAFRTMTVLPFVTLSIGLVFARVVQLAREDGLAHPAVCLSIWGAALGLAAWSSATDLRDYFTKQANHAGVAAAFNAEPTMASREIRDLYREEPTRRVYVWPQLYGWATLKYFVPHAFEGPDPLLAQFDPGAHLPLAPPGGENVSIFLEPSQVEERAMIGDYYPEAAWMERTVESSGVLAYRRCDIPAAAIARTRGLQGVYTPANGAPPTTRRDERIQFDWTVPGALPDGCADGFTVRWRGTLLLRQGMALRLLLVAGGANGETSRAAGRIRIDDDLAYAFPDAATAAAALALAPGLHDIEVEHSWRPGDAGGCVLSFVDPQGNPVDEKSLALFIFEQPPHGLIGQYFAGTSWSGVPLFRRKDRQIEVGAEPQGAFSVQWDGFIHIEQAGQYRFEPNSDDGCDIYINEQLVGSDPGPDRGNRTVTNVALDPGYHPIRIRYWDGGGGRGLQIWFYPPGGSRVKLPSQLLYPRAPS